MPVVSQSRFSTTSSTSLSTGSYRSTLNSSSSLDRPFYSSASGSYVSPRRSAYTTSTVTDYRSQLSYDGDGHRARKSSYSSDYTRYSRAPSVTESESAASCDSRAAPRPERSGSRSRDASVARSDSARSSRSDPSPRPFPGLTSSELYKKYSPNFYVPQAQRLSTAVTGPNGDAGRSKLLGDAARLPLPRRTSARTDDERQRSLRGEGLSGGRAGIAPRAGAQPSWPARLPLDPSTDDNGNDLQLSVAEIRRKFDSKMAATRLRARQPSTLYKTAHSSDNIYSQVRNLNNSAYSLIDDKPVPVHKPTSSDKYINDATGSLRWEFLSPSSGYSSDSKGSRESGYTIKHATDPGSDISTIYIAGKMSAERIPINAVKNQLNANNAMGRILEKSTTVYVGNGDAKSSPSVTTKQERSNEPKNVLNIEIGGSSVPNGKPDDECALKKIPTNHTSDFASYIQVSTPISSGLQNNAEGSKDHNGVGGESPKYTNDYVAKNISCLLSADENDGTKLRYIDSDPNSENDTRLFVEYNGKDDGEQGFENKTFEHENIHLLRKTADEADIRETIKQNGLDEPDFAHSKPKRQNGECDDKHYKVPIKYQNGYAKMTNGTAAEEDDENDHRIEKVKKDESMSAESTLSAKSTLEANGEPASALLQQYTNNIHSSKDSSVPRGNSPLSNTTPSSNYGAVTQRKASAAATEQLSETSGLNGLRNIGNTCFMNSVVQCLSNTRPLMEYCGNPDQFTPDINTTLSCMKGALIKAFSTVISELWREGESDGVVNTTALKAQIQRFAPRFMGYSQQDAQEFLRYLLEGLHEDVNRVTIKPKPILTEIDDNLSDAQKAQESWNRYLRMEDSRVGDIFVGQLKSSLRCTHCNHTSVTFDPFWDLSLPIPSRTGPLKLTQCLSHFTREEELDGDEKPTCSKCQVRRKCLKWFTIQKFPRVLVLHLKRFSPQERFRGKLNVQVEFPLQGLDLGACSAGSRPHLYSLYAVSNHSGTTYSGHYTAYCKHPYNGEWHEYNDSRVSPISAKNVVSSEAYVLFYEMSDNAGSS